MIWFCFIAFLTVLKFCGGIESDINKKLDLKKEILPPCQACKALVSSFLKVCIKINLMLINVILMLHNILLCGLV